MNEADLKSANQLYEAREWRGAMRAYLGMLADVGDQVAGMGLVLHRLGNCFYFEKDFARAVACYERALTDPVYGDRAQVWFNEARCYATLGQWEAAVECYDHVVADPTHRLHDKAHYNRGNALLELGRLEEAVDSFRTAAGDAANASPGAAAYNAGLALMTLGRYREAAQSFYLAGQDRTYGNRAQALLRRAEALDAAGHDEQALSAFEEARVSGAVTSQAQEARMTQLAWYSGEAATAEAVADGDGAGVTGGAVAEGDDAAPAAEPEPVVPYAAPAAEPEPVVPDAAPASDAPASDATEELRPAEPDFSAFRQAAAAFEGASGGGAGIDLGRIVAESLNGRGAPLPTAAGPAARVAETAPEVAGAPDGSTGASGPDETRVAGSAKRTPEQVARAYVDTISPEDSQEMRLAREGKLRARATRMRIAAAVLAVIFVVAFFAAGFFIFDWGIPGREQAITGAVSAWGSNRPELLRTYLVAGSQTIADEFKAVPLPVLNVTVTKFEQAPSGERAIVDVTSGTSATQSQLRYAFDLQRVGLGWRIIRVALQ